MELGGQDRVLVEVRDREIGGRFEGLCWLGLAWLGLVGCA